MTLDLDKQIGKQEFPAKLKGHLIGGQWGFSSEKNDIESRCPSTGRLLAVSCATKLDIKNAINCAHEHFVSNVNLELENRIERIKDFSDIFKKNISTLTKAAILEQGKPLWEVNHDLKAAEKYLDWVANNGEYIKEHLLGPARLVHFKGEFEQKPTGPVAAYLPFSTTIQSFIFFYVASSLSNCPMIMFSSKHNLLQASILADMAHHSNLLNNKTIGSFQMILAGFDDFRMALGDRRIAAVLYTGSRDHCDEIRDDSSSFPERRLILQSGGKNTTIIDKNTDLKMAVNSVFMGAFRSSGQLCSSTNRVAIHESLFNEFRTLVSKAIREMHIGPTHTTDHNPFMGPLFSAKAVERFLRYQTMAAREAEDTISWGKAFEPKDPSAINGNFVRPGIHLMPKIVESSYQKSVIVCPDIAVYKFTDIESAIVDIANQTDAPFAVSFFGEREVLNRHLALFEAPNILYNLPTTEVEACLPLAGKYASGFHRFHGPSIVHYLLNPVSVQSEEDVKDIIDHWPKLV